MLKYILLLNSLFLLSSGFTQNAQPQIIDQVKAVVGDEIILQSEIEQQIVQLKSQGAKSANLNCEVAEQFLMEKLLLHNAKVDSLEVSEDQLEGELDRRLRYFIAQVGSQEKFEEFYGKSIVKFKEEFREVLRNQIMVQNMQGEITKGINVTPADVEKFFHSIPKDSIPLMNAEVEMAQIVLYPKVRAEEKKRVRDKLNGFLEEVRNGKDFSTLAILYSEDPGSAGKGGELGMVNKGAMVPEFDAVALSLQNGGLSDVFETQYGYHIMQMIDRRGEKYNARHILMKPRVNMADLTAAKLQLDTLRDEIEEGIYTFAEAAEKYSHDEDTKNNGGIIMNTSTGSPRFDMSQLDPQLFFSIDKMEENEVSQPAILTNQSGKKGYRIIKLLERTEPHRANLIDDYKVIYDVASQQLQEKELTEWITKKVKETFVKLDEDIKQCEFQYQWNKQEKK